MAGLLNPGTAPADAPPADAPPADTVGDEEGMDPNVSPEEQEAYEAFVTDGLALIYEGGEVRPGILKLLDEDPADLMEVLKGADELRDFTPVIALAATAVVVVLELVRRAGEQRPDDAVIMHGGQAILEDLAEVSEAAGFHDFAPDEMDRAFQMAADLYREAAVEEGLVDNEALKAEFEQIVAADREGRLGEVLPGLEQAPPEQAAPEGMA